MLSGNRPELFELLGAAALRGLTLVMLNARASTAEIAAVIDDAQPRAVFFDPPLQGLLAALPPSLPQRSLESDRSEAGAEPVSAVAAEVEDLDLGVDPSLPWVGIPTAAVEGRPRVALLSQAALLHQAHEFARAWRLQAHDRQLGVLPLFHVAGLVMALADQAVGGASVLMERFDPGEAVQAIERWQVSHFISFSPILERVLDAASAAGAPLASLRAVTGLESPSVVARLMVQCPAASFWVGYGQTETCGMVTLSPAAERPGSAGRPLPTVALRIAQADGTPVPPGQSGEIQVRGPFVFSGYWRRPAATAQANVQGWHRTGDLGRLDADGHLWFEGRAPEKALIKSGGENIYPAEVEDALLAHPGVEAAVVFGVVDAQWGEAVRAVCVCRAGQPVTAQALAEFVGERIARFKRPREIVFVASLPQLPGGGWDRVAIRAAHGG